MLNDAMTCNYLKQSMLEASKHKASQAHCTTTMQYMSHMAKTTQKSPRACQIKAKSMHGLELTHARIRGMKHGAYKAKE